MESPTVPQFISQNSKKRVFPGGSSSSSSGCKEVDVMEIPPPVNRTSKSTSSKQKEVICHEIIDVDMEEDSNDIMLIEGEVGKSAKGKEALSSFSNGVSNISNNVSGSDLQTPNNGAMDDLSSDLFYGEDEWIDTYYEDILFDDYAIMESHFDHMDFPPGVEAPFPWLPSPRGYDTNVPTTSTPINSSSQLQTTGVNLSTGLSSSHSPYALKPVQIKELPVSRGSLKIGTLAGSHRPKGKLPSKWLGPDTSQKKWASSSSPATGLQPPTGSLNHKYDKEPLYSFGKSKRRPRASHVNSSLQNQLNPPNQSNPPGALPPTNAFSWSNYPTSHFPQTAYAMGSYMPMWEELPINMSSMGSTGFMTETAFSSQANGLASKQNGGSPIGTSAPTTVEQKDVNEILQKFSLFKKFDTVESFSDHHYSKNGSSAKQPQKGWSKRIQEEWKILEKDLPDTIFVRVYESRMDLLRAVIVGAEGTPYHDGLFFFDIYFPSSYPNVPPHVHYHSGGLRLNPNLYNCGKVCLSLLNTWSGSHKEKWIPGVSTMLQVLVSIQGLILNAKPYFNEPGYANLSGSVSGEKSSLEYNERVFIYSLQTMVYNMRRPPKYFEDFVAGHFCKHARDILISCKAYLDGAQVGCLVRGGVQDVDEGDKSSSQHFRHSLAGFITTLVNAFSLIGAQDCQEFLSLAQKANAPQTAGLRQMTMQFAT